MRNDLRPTKQRNDQKKRLIIFIILLPVVAFLTWFLIKFVTIRADLSVVSTYDFPDTADISGMEVDARDFAVAIDSKVVAGKSYEARETKQLPTASTAKIILGLMIMEQKPFGLNESGETITITSEMFQKYLWYYANGGSNTRVAPGEEISEYDALMSVFLASSNNMADSLAIWAFGSLDEYASFAMAKLMEWGITDTTIGSDASCFSDSTKSTAEDLAVLAARLMDNPVLAEIVGTKSYDVPVAGLIENTNKTLGQLGIVGVKTGYIGDASGYCLVTAYHEGEHIVTVSLLGAETREDSFSESLKIVETVQDIAKTVRLINRGDVVGYYNSWWTGPVEIRSSVDFDEVLWGNASKKQRLEMAEKDGELILSINDTNYNLAVEAADYAKSPSFWDKVRHVFGWEKH